MRKEKFIEFETAIRQRLVEQAQSSRAALEYNDLIHYTIGYITADCISDINFTGAQLRKIFNIPKEVWAQVHGLPSDH